MDGCRSVRFGLMIGPVNSIRRLLLSSRVEKTPHGLTVTIAPKLTAVPKTVKTQTQRYGPPNRTPKATNLYDVRRRKLRIR